MLENIKSKITYNNKTYIGIVIIAIGIIFYFICCNNFDFFDFILIMIPAIFLCIPSKKIKNNWILGCIFVVWSILIIIFSIIGILYSSHAIIPPDHLYNALDKTREQIILELRFCFLIKTIYGIICLIASLLFFVDAD